MAKLLRARYPFLEPAGVLDHLVVGAGVVGLALGERLVNSFAGRSTFIVERHGQAGQETSSRNSEVIHSGLYYPSDSLKASLCIRGRDLLYARCRASDIPYRQTGKLILATSRDQLAYLSSLTKKSKELSSLGVGNVPLEWYEGDAVRKLEPDVGENVVGALFSPLTGIVSSHDLMASMEESISNSDMGELVYGTRVVRIDRAQGKNGGKRGDGSEDGWVVQTVTDDGSGGDGERASVLVKVVINAAGLNAVNIVNQILPESSQQRLFYAKGSYFTYRGPGHSSVKHLLYPCPDASLAGLGTHLTMNLDNEIRFGPDAEWLQAPIVDGEDEPDFWEKHLSVSEERAEKTIAAAMRLLPGLDPKGFSPDYAGIRPKLSPAGVPAVDFSITHPFPGFISLTGIESPGLTSSLAIAEKVEQIVRSEVWGLGRGSGRVLSEAGGVGGDGWS